MGIWPTWQSSWFDSPQAEDPFTTANRARGRIPGKELAPIRLQQSFALPSGLNLPAIAKKVNKLSPKPKGTLRPAPVVHSSKILQPHRRIPPPLQPAKLTPAHPVSPVVVHDSARLYNPLLFTPDSVHNREVAARRRMSPIRHRVFADKSPAPKTALNIDEDVVGLAELEQELGRLLQIERPESAKMSPAVKKMRIFEVSHSAGPALGTILTSRAFRKRPKQSNSPHPHPQRNHPARLR